MAVATAPQAAATTRQPKGWLATLVVALVMVGIVGGGFVAQESVADAPPLPVTLDRGVVVTPGADWEFAGRSEDGQTVLLTQGSGSLALTVMDGTDIQTALESQRAEWLASGTITATDPEPVTVGGHAGRRFEYSGTFDDLPTPVDGTVTAIAGSNYVVLFDGWAGAGDYSAVSDDIDSMIGSAVIP
jgi:hypothetical protein